MRAGNSVNIGELIEFHRSQKALATLTATQPPGRFGALTLGSAQTHVHSFREKPGSDGAWINGGFFVVEPAVMGYIAGDATVWEKEPLEKLAQEGALAAYKHRGFWHPMDTLRDRIALEELWASGKAPWKIWDGLQTKDNGGSGLSYSDTSRRFVAEDRENRDGAVHK